MPPPKIDLCCHHLLELSIAVIRHNIEFVSLLRAIGGMVLPGQNWNQRVDHQWERHQIDSVSHPRTYRFHQKLTLHFPSWSKQMKNGSKDDCFYLCWYHALTLDWPHDKPSDYKKPINNNIDPALTLTDRTMTWVSHAGSWYKRKCNRVSRLYMPVRWKEQRPALS